MLLRVHYNEAIPPVSKIQKMNIFFQLHNYHHILSLVDGALETKFNLQKRFTITENAYYY